MNKVQNIGIKAVEYWNTTLTYQYCRLTYSCCKIFVICSLTYFHIKVFPCVG